MLDQGGQGVEALAAVRRGARDEDPPAGLETEHGLAFATQRRDYRAQQVDVESRTNADLRTTYHDGDGGGRGHRRTTDDHLDEAFRRRWTVDDRQIPSADDLDRISQALPPVVQPLRPQIPRTTKR